MDGQLWQRLRFKERHMVFAYLETLILVDTATCDTETQLWCRVRAPPSRPGKVSGMAMPPFSPGGQTLGCAMDVPVPGRHKVTAGCEGCHTRFDADYVTRVRAR